MTILPYRSVSIEAKRGFAGEPAYTMFGILMIFFWMAYCTSCALL
jgi:hypothetical protein